MSAGTCSPVVTDSADSVPADYVLFYARIHTFPEDNQCRMKTAARQVFRELATGSKKGCAGLKVQELRLLLPRASETPRSREWAPYQSVYWGFRAPDVDVLLREAEYVKMELPLKGRDGKPLSTKDDDANAEDGTQCCCSCLQPEATAFNEDGTQPTDENADFISAPFIFKKKHLFYGGTGSEFSLTGAQRIYLTHSILQRIDVAQTLRELRKKTDDKKLELCGPSCMYCSSMRGWLNGKDPIVLEHLMEANIFSDGFAMHDPPEAPKELRSKHKKCRTSSCCCGSQGEVDVEPECNGGVGSWRPQNLREQLSRHWHCCCRFQPLRLIRLYFGERLAFYYAWFGYIIWCLLFLTAIGLSFFVYGLANASINYKNASIEVMREIAAATTDSSFTASSSYFISELMQFILLSFENYLTIVFGCILTVWGLLTTETWKRYESSLSYRWDMNHYFLAENRRPNYVLKKSRCQPVWCTQQTGRRKCVGFYSCVVSSVIVVFAITVGFQVARLVGDASYCTAGSSGAACFFIGTILPISGQVVVIAVLDSLYSLVAKAVTNWECHEYPTDYDNSFAIKAFAFRFANNYSPLFYIAFVRQGHIEIGNFKDYCSLASADIDCFNLLNIMTAVYMVGKSLLKSGVDIFWPYLKRWLLTGCTLKLLRGLLSACCPCAKSLAYSLELEILADLERCFINQGREKPGLAPARPSHLGFAEQRHLAKSKENEMLLDEYLEKVILYGFMIMFGSAFYLAPVAALIAMAIDLRLDSHRLLFLYRRPVPLPAQGIGVWNWMLDFLSFAGIFTTGAILAFTSKSLDVYGVSTSDASRLTFFVIFENVMLAVKFLLLVSIGDVPRKLKLCLKWEYFYVKKILTDDEVAEGVMDSLKKMEGKNRWYHALFPCCANITTPNPEAGPQLV